MPQLESRGGLTLAEFPPKEQGGSDKGGAGKWTACRIHTIPPDMGKHQKVGPEGNFQKEGRSRTEKSIAKRKGGKERLFTWIAFKTGEKKRSEHEKAT